MRVAIISEHAPPATHCGGVDSGGQNVYVEQIALNLAAVGIEVDVYTRRASASAPAVKKWRGIRIIYVTAGPAFPIPKEQLLPYMEEFSKSTLKFIQEHNLKYDIVHANFWMSGLVAVFLKRQLEVPFVITFHALGKVRRAFLGENDTWGDERLQLEQEIIEAADLILAQCPQDKEDLLKFYRVSPYKLRIIPCGVSDFEFWEVKKDKAREYVDFPQDDFILLNVGRLLPRKGVDNIIYAVAYLKKHYKINVKLAIVGGETDTPSPEATPEIGRLIEIAASSGVQDQILFAGRRKREELKYYYSAADVFVTTPWYEPFGITPLEAMECGTPVVGSRVGGIQYSVTNEETGLLVEPRNPQELAEAILRLYQNPQLRELYGEQGQKKVLRFRWDKIATAVLLVYEEVLTQPPLPIEKEFMPVHRAINGLEAACSKAGDLLPFLVLAAENIRQCFVNKGKLLLAGNGGSAAQCQHLAAELVGQFQKLRGGLPAIALTADTALLTAWANDMDFTDIFARQIEALAQPQDIFLCLSTSGRSRNLICAIERCQRLNIKTIAILGGNGGEIAALVDAPIIVPGDNPQRIQEMQLFALHLLVELIEDQPILNNQNGKVRVHIHH